MPKKVEQVADAPDAALKSKKKTTKTAAKPATSKPKAKSGSKTSKAKKPAPKTKDGKKIRYFKLIDGDSLKTYGRYVGDTPKQAASKGFSKLVKKYKVEKKKLPANLTIYTKESTRKGPGKVYAYVANRNKLDKPQLIKIKDANGGDKQIKYEFRNDIRKGVVPPKIGGLAKKSKSKKEKPKKSSKSSKSGEKKKAPSKAKVAKKSGSKTASKKPTKKPAKKSSK